MTENGCRVLVVDDSRVLCLTVNAMLKAEDIIVNSCGIASEAMGMALTFKPTVILQDLVMPDVEGLDMVRMFKTDPRTQDIPLVMLSSTEDPKVKSDSFAEGANDYIVKLPDRLELLARVRYHSKGYRALVERNQAYQQIADDLVQAADYVLAQLPAPIRQGPVLANWLFEPCSMIGGDLFGYFSIDTESLALYLLDTSGHGIGSCLMSISVGDMLRRQVLPGVDFHNPGQVLEELARIYPLDPKTGKYFTIWYGVYHSPTRTLKYSGAGHPPALIVRHDRHTVDELPSSGPFIGIDAMTYENEIATLSPGDCLYLFSDGVFEIRDHESGAMWSFDQLKALLTEEVAPVSANVMDHVLSAARKSQGHQILADDFAMVEFKFSD
ncbi:MAG: fused response regulator/phosphatase [Planctomycetota bacterium]